MKALTFTNVWMIYYGSDGDATRGLYTELAALGSMGHVAVNLFRAQKCSERAKVYRGGDRKGSWRNQAYDRKQWSMDNLCKVLTSHGGEFTWGWGVDPNTIGFEHVLYVDLPTGQVSFHTDRRGDGPEYPGKWDGVPGQSADRIIRWVGSFFEAATPALTHVDSSSAPASADCGAR